MFDLFGVSVNDLKDSHVHHETNFLAMAMLLIEKGIITDDEFSRARARATAIVDQIVAEQKEEAIKEFDEKFPGVRKMFFSTEQEDATGP